MKTNPELKKLIADLRSLGTKEKVKLWKRVADDLSKSTRSKREVNLYKIEKYLRDGEIGIVPGKVLGVGEASKKTVAAFQFSKSAKEKLNAMTIRELMNKNPKAKKVRILG